jgi:antitoxin HigA-1
MPTRSTFDRTIEPKMRAVHPGEIIAEALDDGLRLSVAEAARRLGVSRQQLHRVLSGRAQVTPDMALRIGRLLGNGPDLWLALQAKHDLSAARRRLGVELERVPEYAE